MAGVLLGLAHGYDLIVVYALVGSLALVGACTRPRNWTRPLLLAALVCGPSVPTALYNLYVTSTSPIWRGVLAQYGNAGVLTPSPLHLLILLGLPLIFTLSSLPTIAWNGNPAQLVAGYGWRPLVSSCSGRGCSLASHCSISPPTIRSRCLWIGKYRWPSSALGPCSASPAVHRGG